MTVIDKRVASNLATIAQEAPKYIVKRNPWLHKREGQKLTRREYNLYIDMKARYMWGYGKLKVSKAEVQTWSPEQKKGFVQWCAKRGYTLDWSIIEEL